MLKRSFLGLCVISAGVGWYLTAPTPLPHAVETALMTSPADPGLGEQVFWASGCASCHISEGAAEIDAPLLSGGQAFMSEFGTFFAPNISPGPEGIGGWTLIEFANAVQAGISPGGAHYYPAFPYTAYAKANPEDIAALYAYMQTLPHAAIASKPHDVGFPFNIRRSLGGWKLLFSQPDFTPPSDPTRTTPSRGQYLSEALAHCAECHTPRNALGGLDTSRWMAGAPNPNGRGRIPNITPAALDWSEADLLAYLRTGLTPDYDSVGGHMASVVSNMARLPEQDVQAIVQYIKALPPIPDPI